MTKRTRVILLISIITSIIGTLSKLNGYKNFGDIFLAIGAVSFLYLIFKFIYNLINKKSASF